jgi:hypothetical protein
VAIITHIEGREDASKASEFEGGFGIYSLFFFNKLKWSLERIGKVCCGVGERPGCGQRQPRRSRNDDGPRAIPGFALVGELQCRGA